MVGSLCFLRKCWKKSKVTKHSSNKVHSGILLKQDNSPCSGTWVSFSPLIRLESSIISRNCGPATPLPGRRGSSSKPATHPSYGRFALNPPFSPALQFPTDWTMRHWPVTRFE